MAHASRDLPLWVPIVLGVALVGGVAWRFADSAILPTPAGGARTEAAQAESWRVPPQPTPGSQAGVQPGGVLPSEPAAEAPTGYAPEPRRVRLDVLGRWTAARFAFDPNRPGRVVSCESESLDGGGTWRRLGQSPAERSIALGGSRAPAPVLRAGRILCADAILPTGPGAPPGVRVGDVQAAVEWNGRDWRPVGLPVAQRAGAAADGRAAVAVGYAPDGSAIAVRGDRLVTPAGDLPLPGTADAWAVDRRGAIYASIAPEGRRARGMWAAGPQAAWQDLPVPGEVRGIAADGDRVWIAAGMLGRGQRERWDWTRWPEDVRIDGVAGAGETVVAWGDLSDRDDRGALVVSRDGGVTLEVRRLERLRPIWAAVDPYRPGEVLLLAEDGAIARAYLD